MLSQFDQDRWNHLWTKERMEYYSTSSSRARAEEKLIVADPAKFPTTGKFKEFKDFEDGCMNCMNCISEWWYM
jgi:hypothetical protein